MSLSMYALLLMTSIGMCGLYARQVADDHYRKAVTFADSIVGRQEAETARRYHVTAAALFVAAIATGAASIVLRLGAGL